MSYNTNKNLTVIQNILKITLDS